MSRLKIELESCYAEDRAEALQIAQTESLAEIVALKESFSVKEKELWKEVHLLSLQYLMEFHCIFIADRRTESIGQ